MATRFGMVWLCGAIFVALAGCGNDTTSMGGPGGMGGAPPPPDNSAGSFSVVSLSGLVDRCNETDWPFDCNVTPGVEDPSVFQGDCACSELWLHEATGLYVCQELPSSCGGATIFDVAGWPLPAPVWDSVEFYDEECCTSTSCNDPAALAEVDGIVRDCDVNWTYHCALQLHRSKGVNVCPAPNPPSWIVDDVMVALTGRVLGGSNELFALWDGSAFPPYFIAGGSWTNDRFDFEPVPKRNGYYHINVHLNDWYPGAPAKRFCVFDFAPVTVPDDPDDRSYYTDLAEGVGSSGRSCQWTIDYLENDRIGLRSRYMMERIADPDFEEEKTRQTPQLGVDTDGGGIVRITQGETLPNEIPVAGVGTAPVGCHNEDLNLNMPCQTLDFGVQVPTYRMFVTKQKLFGIELFSQGGDVACQEEAEAASLIAATPGQGRFLSWTPTTNFDAVDRVRSKVPYVRMDGVRVARNRADLVDGTIEAPIELHADGSKIGDEQVWTLTGADGKRDGRCDPFPNDLGGAVGNPHTADSRWTAEGSDLDCVGPKHPVYCIEVEL